MYRPTLEKTTLAQQYYRSNRYGKWLGITSLVMFLLLLQAVVYYLCQ